LCVIIVYMNSLPSQTNKIFLEKEKWIKICNFFINFVILAIVFLIPIVFSIFGEVYNIFELNKIVYLRILLIIGVLFYILKVFILEKIKYKFSSIIFLFSFLVVLSYLISTLLSIHPHVSFFGEYRRIQGFSSLIFYILFFIFSILNFKDKKQINRVLTSVLFSSFIVCFYGIIQYFSLDFLEWKEPFLLSGRIFSTLGQPNFLAHFLILVLPLTIYYLFFVVKRFIFRFLIFILLFLQIFCLVSSGSRAALLGFLVSFSIFSIFIFFRKNGREIKISVILFFVLCSLFFTSFAQNSFSPTLEAESLKNRVSKSTDFNSGSVNIRLKYWQASLNEFKNQSFFRKIFGSGPDILKSLFIKHYESSWAVSEKLNMLPDRAHNLIFDNILQFGILGFLAVLIFFLYIIKETLRFLLKEKNSQKTWLAIASFCSLSAYFVNNLFSFSGTTEYIYLFLILSILVFVIYEEKKEKIIKIKLNIFLRFVIFTLFLFLALILIFFYNIQALKADSYFALSQKYKQGGYCFAFLDLNKRAIDLGYFDNFYKREYIETGSKCVDSFSSVEAGDAVKNIILFYIDSIPEKEHTFYTDISFAYAKTIIAYNFDENYYPEAEKEFKEILDKYPQMSSPYLRFAYLKIKQNKTEEAIDILEKGIKILPDISNPYFNKEHRDRVKLELGRFYEIMAFSYEKGGDSEKTLEYYQKIIDLDPYYIGIYKKIADVYYNEKQLDKSLEYIERGYAFEKDNYIWPFSKAIILREMKREEEAIFYAKKALEISPNQKDIINFLKR